MGRNSKYSKLINDMGVFAQSEYPREACGIITNKFKFIPCKNLSSTPKSNFILDPIALLEYEDNAWGIFHSHPGDENPLPSEEDISHTIFTEYKFIVGFASKFYIYWYDDAIKALKYEVFEEKYLNVSDD